MLLPAYPLDDLRKALRGLGFERFIESVDLEPFQAGPLTLTIHALVAPDGRPDRRFRAADRRRRGPRPEHERLAAARARPAARRRAARRRVPAVLRGDLVPDGLRLPGQRPAGPRPQEARRPVGAGAAATSRCSTRRSSCPSAGPPCFLDDDLFEFNDLHGDEWNTFPDQPTFLDYIAEHGRDGGRLMLPGSVADVAPGRFDVTPSGRPGHDLRRQARLPRGVPGAQARRSSRPSGPPGRAPRVDLLPELKAWWDPLLEQADMICAGIDQPRPPRRRRRADRHRLRDPRGAAAGRRTRTRATSSPSTASSSTISSASMSRTGSTSCSCRCASGHGGAARTTTTSTPGSSA